MTRRERKAHRAAAKRAKREPSKPSGEQPRRAGLRYVLVFCGLFALLDLAFVAWFRTTSAFDTYLGWNASGSAALLSALGHDVVAEGRRLLGPTSLSIESGCDGLQPLTLFACAVVAFPIAWRPKAVAMALGGPALLLLNLVRVVTLYEALERDASVFESLHLAIWPMAFVLFALAAWAVWVAWATSERAVDDVEEATCASAP